MKYLLLISFIHIFFYAKAQEEGNVWIVAVNVYEYQNEELLPKLDYSSNGAFEFAQLYDSRQLLISEPEVLINHKAEREVIIAKLNQTFVSNPKLTSNDLAIFYFSGHGGMAGKEVGICPYDYSGDARDLITDEDILEIMNKSKAKHKICFIEACKSQVVIMGIYNPKTLNDLNAQRKNIKSGLAYVTSAEAGKESRGLFGESGFFTKYLLKGLKKDADKNNNNIITISEIYAYLKLKVPEVSYGQIPQINDGGFDGNMPVMIVPENYNPANEKPLLPESKPIVVKKPCEINGTGELCISNNSGSDRWIKINNKVTPLPKGAEECIGNLKIGHISYIVTNYPPGGGYYNLGGSSDYSAEIIACSTTRKSIRY